MEKYQQNDPNRELISLSNLQKFVEECYKTYLNTTYGGTDQDREREKNAKELLRTQANDAYAGIESDKKAIKQFITSILVGGRELYLKSEERFVIDRVTIDYLFDWMNPPIYVKFLAILYTHVHQYKRDTLTYIIEHYELNQLRPCSQYDEEGEPNYGLYIDDEDIDYIYEDMDIELPFELKLDIVVQCIYEEFKGNGCIDELIYQNIEDISIGVSGLPDPIEPYHLIGIRYPKAYESVWIKYKGSSMQLRFLTFSTFENLNRVVELSVKYKQNGAFSEKEGFKLGYGKDGSRRTAARFPFSENSAAWVRNFTVKDKTNRELIQGKNIGGVQNIIMAERALIRGGANIPICGPQGAGKTTKLAALCEYTESIFGIRVIESEFELKLRERYPDKNILSLQTPYISPEKAYEASLRMSGDIYILSEVRSDEMMVNVTRTAHRGGRCVLFSYHPITPRDTILETANSLLRAKIFNSIKDAMYTALNSIRCCIHIENDFEKACRYYNIYEFVPIEVVIESEYKRLSGSDRKDSFMDTIYSYMLRTTSPEYFKTVPIITFDRYKKAYTFQNNISDSFYDDLMLKTVRVENKLKLEMLFRPEAFIERHIKAKKIKSIEHFGKYHGLNMDFVKRRDVKDYE